MAGVLPQCGGFVLVLMSVILVVQCQVDVSTLIPCSGDDFPEVR